MINNPVTLFPCYGFITIAVICFAAWGEIIPLPSWMQTLGLYMGMAAFVFACMAALDWMIDRVTRYANIDDLLDPDARVAEAVRLMNHDQLEVMYTLYGYDPDDRSADENVTLDDGTPVNADAIIQISKGAHGVDLRPEREYKYNQVAVRQAHDALSRTGIIDMGRGPHGPRVKNADKFQQVIQLATQGRFARKRNTYV